MEKTSKLTIYLPILFLVLVIVIFGLYLLFSGHVMNSSNSKNIKDTEISERTVNQNNSANDQVQSSEDNHDSSNNEDITESKKKSIYRDVLLASKIAT